MNPAGVWPWLLVPLLASLAWWATGRVIVWAHRRALLDVPGKRRSHAQATPTGGGLAFVLLWLLAVIPLTTARPEMIWVWLMTGLLSLLGWVDDLRNLSVRTRLLVQFLAAIVLVVQWFQWLEPTQWPGFAAGLLALMLLLSVVWYINAFNFMDGIDGIAVQQGLFTMGFLAWLGWNEQQPLLFWPALSMFSVLLGFLPRNLSPARLFMGDAGSLPLGYLSVALTGLAWAMDLLKWPASLMLLAVFNLDAFLTLVKRWFSNKRCYTPHREHLYQWLARSGYSHMQVSGAHALINLLVVLPLTLWLNQLEEMQGVGGLLLVSLVWASVWWHLQRQLLKKRKASHSEHANAREER